MKLRQKLILAAIAAGAAGSAFAAGVEIYGVVDTGLAYMNAPEKDGGDRQSSLEMKTGIMMGNRLGIRGQETVSQNLKVSFVLETGFDADSGQFFSYGGDRSRLFGREAQLSLHTAAGTFSFGRMGNLMSGNGTYGIWATNASPFSIGYLHAGSQYTMQGYTRLDNAISYKTPTAYGFTGYAQYSFERNGQEKSEFSDNNHYASVGLVYASAPLKTMLIAEWLDRASSAHTMKDMYLIGANVSYDFGFVKPYAAVQYQQNADTLFAAVDGTKIKTKAGDNEKGISGSAWSLGADVPVAKGTFKCGLQYFNGEDKSSAGSDFERFIVSAAYRYPLSKRTTLYAGANYVKDDLKSGSVRVDDDLVSVYSGLNHRF